MFYPQLFILVSFYKRAQILIGDIWACFKGQDYGRFNDINYITMFADYRIPQVLIHFGAIRYSNPLLSKLQSGKLIYRTWFNIYNRSVFPINTVHS